MRHDRPQETASLGGETAWPQNMRRTAGQGKPAVIALIGSKQARTAGLSSSPASSWFLPRCYSRSAPAEHDLYGSKQNPEIKPNAPAFDVGEIQSNIVLKRRARPGGDLPQAGEAGGDIEPFEMLQTVLLIIIKRVRPGTHQAHVAAENIPELRQFIQAIAAQPISHSGETWVGSNFKTWPGTLIAWAQAVLQSVCVHHHRPELETGELPAFSTRSHGLIKDRTMRIQFDQNRYHSQNRGSNDQAKAGGDKIQSTLPQLAEQGRIHLEQFEQCAIPNTFERIGCRQMTEEFRDHCDIQPVSGSFFHHPGQTVLRDIPDDDFIDKLGTGHARQIGESTKHVRTMLVIQKTRHSAGMEFGVVKCIGQLAFLRPGAHNQDIPLRPMRTRIFEMVMSHNSQHNPGEK